MKKDDVLAIPIAHGEGRYYTDNLKELEEKKLISREKSGKNVYYTIMDSGRKVLEALETLINLF